MLKDKIKFIRMVVVFCICFLGLFFVVNSLYNRYILGDNELEYDDNQFIKNFNNNIEIIIFGDSRVATAINPTYIPNLYNYATPGEIYSQTYYKARKILNSDNKLTTIVLPYDLQSFSKYRTGSFSNVRFWLRYMTIDELARETNRPFGAIYINSLFPFIGNGRDFVNFSFVPKTHTEKIKGWIKHEPGGYWEMSSDEKEKDGYGRAREHLKHYPELINQDLLNSFIKILEFAKEKNKQVILVKYPVAKYYIKGMEKVGLNREYFYNELNKQIEKYDNITILDYQEEYEDEWFYNSDHFHYEGAEVFSKQLGEDLGFVK